jgi:nitroimidazol reductase NimA-like FMN-containing flavoprotein (pyridoxamine 5'-phosphate oxidase superfamily)
MTVNTNNFNKETGMTSKADTKFKREAKRGSHDYDLACAVLDAGKICHVGFTLDGQPYVVPMAYTRMGDQVIIHGSIASRMVKNLADGLQCCITTTHFDGLVYARSSFNSSMNYRSVMVFGVAHLIDDKQEKQEAVDALVDHLMPGRRADLRASTRKELNATSFLKLPLETFSVKQRVGGPSDSKSDMDTRIWAGVVPLNTVAGEPIDSPDLMAGLDRPDYL